MQIKNVMKGPNEIVAFDHHAITYPQLASQKFDGYRMLNLCGERQLSPAMKDFPNLNLFGHLLDLNNHLKRHRLVVDGEIWSPYLTFDELKSIIRSFKKPVPSHVKYYIFDIMSESEWDNENEQPFLNRYLEYSQGLRGFPNVLPVEQYHVIDATEAEDMFNQQIRAGHEGIILRQHHARYKHGRTTLNQDGMWKFKEFLTQDGIIIGVEEQMRLKAGVERTRDERGQLEREYRAELYEPAGMVGAFLVEHEGKRFKVKPGKGYDNDMKINLWELHNTLIGAHCEFKHMPHGAKDKPRIGSLVRLRPDLD